MTPHQALLDAINENNEKELDRLLTENSINIRDFAGHTVLTRLLIEGKSPIDTRITKAWWLHDYKGASLDGMVRGLAAAGELEKAYALCDAYNIPHIEVALGLAYSGNQKGLDEYFKKYDALDAIAITDSGAIEVSSLSEEEQNRVNKRFKFAVAEALIEQPRLLNEDLAKRYQLRDTTLTREEKIHAEETRGAIASALICAAKIYGQQKVETYTIDIATQLSEIIVLKDLKQVQMGKLACEYKFLLSYCQYIVIEALAVMAETKKDIDAILEKNQIEELQCINTALSFIYKGLVKKRDEESSLCNYVHQRVTELSGSSFLNEKEIINCKLQGYAEVGNIEPLKEELEKLKNNETAMHDASRFCIEKLLENGYWDGAVQISAAHGQSLDIELFGAKQDTACNIMPSWMRHAFLSPTQKLLSYYGCSSFPQFIINPIFYFRPTSEGAYKDDKMLCTVFLKNEYNALHYLCFISDKSQEELIKYIYAPILGEEKAKEWLKKASAILKIQEGKKIGFRIASIYYDEVGLFKNAVAFLKLFARFLPPEIRLHILSFVLSKQYSLIVVRELYNSVSIKEIREETQKQSKALEKENSTALSVEKDIQPSSCALSKRL